MTSFKDSFFSIKNRHLCFRVVGIGSTVEGFLVVFMWLTSLATAICSHRQPFKETGLMEAIPEGRSQHTPEGDFIILFHSDFADEDSGRT